MCRESLQRNDRNLKKIFQQKQKRISEFKDRQQRLPNMKQREKRMKKTELTPKTLGRYKKDLACI